MSMLKKLILVCLIISLSLYAGTIDEAMQAYEKKDYQKTLKLSTSLCENNNSKGCNILGNLYFFKLGVKKDYQKARELYKKSCDGGNAEGCFSLGTTYEATSAKQDFDKAKKLYKKACDGNFMKACANLGIAVAFHSYTKEDYKMAMYGLTKACESGAYPDIGCFNLFMLYASTKEMDKAKKYAKKSCNEGVEKACSMIKTWDVMFKK